MQQYLNYASLNANTVANALSGNVSGLLGNVGQYMGFFSNLFGGHSASSGISFKQQKELQANSAKTTYELNKKLMDYQYKLERESRRNSFVDTKKDLIKAGYNPLLAIGNQSGYVGVSSGVSAQDPIAENAGLDLQRSSAKANWVAKGLDALNTISGIRSSSANTALMRAQANEVAHNAQMERNLKASQMDLNASQTQSYNINNDIKMQTGLEDAKAEIENKRSQTYKNLQEAGAINSQVILNNVKANAVSAESAIEQERREDEKIRNKADIDFRTNHPHQAAFLDMVERYGRAFGSIAGNNNVTVNSGGSSKKKGGKKK